jgi:hypothetical protein
MLVPHDDDDILRRLLFSDKQLVTLVAKWAGIMSVSGGRKNSDRHFIPWYAPVLAVPSAWGRTSRLHFVTRRRSPSFSSRRARMVGRSFSPTVDRTFRWAGYGYLTVDSTVSRLHTMWFLPVGMCEGPCVSATSTCLSWDAGLLRLFSLPHQTCWTEYGSN